MQLEKPIKPNALDYNLSEERVAHLSDGIPIKYHIFLLSVVSLIIATILISNQKSFGEIFGIVLSIFLFGGVFSYPISNFFWLYSQKDYSQYKLYKKALDQFNSKYIAWLRRQVSFWQESSGRTFELLLAKSFREKGVFVEITGGKDDGGIDLILSQNNQKIAIQCKAHKKPIGPAMVRELYGAINHRNTFSEGWLVSTNGFTKATRIFAHGKNIKLYSIEELLSKEII